MLYVCWLGFFDICFRIQSNRYDVLPSCRLIFSFCFRFSLFSLLSRLFRRLMFRACVHIHSFLFLQYSPTNASVGVLSSIPSSSVLLIYSLFSASFAEVCATSAMPSRWWRRAVSSPSPCSLRLCRSSSLFLRRVSLRFSWRSFRCALSSGVSFGSRRRRDRDRDLDLDLDLRRPLLLFRLLRVSSRCFSFAFCSGVPSFSIFAWRSARVFFPKKAASILEAAFF